jgi:hypothetical protein
LLLANADDGGSSGCAAAFYERSQQNAGTLRV